MTDAEWFALCFRWWAPYVRFCLSNECEGIDRDVTHLVLSEGFVP